MFPGTAPFDATLFDIGSVWKFLDDGSDQGTAWKDIGFDDSSWASGSAELGYGEGDEATLLSFGPDGDMKFTTTYYRSTFDVAGSPATMFVLSFSPKDDRPSGFFLK